MDFTLTHNDLKITNGDIALLSGQADILAQQIAIRLKTLMGEWFLDGQIGIPYFSQILGRKQNSPILKKLITKELLSIAGIKEIRQFSLEETSERAVKLNLQINNQLNINQEFKI